MRSTIVVFIAGVVITAAGCYIKPAIVELKGEVFQIGSRNHNPEIVWEKTFGSGFYEDAAYSIVALKEGGYLLAGVRYGSAVDDRKERVYMTEIDNFGEVSWDSTFWYYMEPTGVLTACEKADGNLLLTGWNIEGGFFTGHIWEFNKDKVMLWNDGIGKGGYYYVASLAATQDSGFVAAGETTAGGGAGKNIFIAKFTAKNRLQWVEYSDGKMNDGLTKIIETEDGYAACGYTNTWSNGDEDVYVVKIDKEGKKIWSKNFGGIREDEGFALCSSKEGGFVIAGYSKSFSDRSEDIYVIKTDGNGNALWENIYGGKFDDRAYAIIPTDKGYLVAGYSETGIFREADFYAMEIDENGKVIWEGKFGYKNIGQAWGIAKAIDGGYVMAGVTKPFYGKSDVYAVKIRL